MKLGTILLTVIAILLWSSPVFSVSADLDSYDFTAAQQELDKIAQLDLESTSFAQVDLLMQQLQVYLKQAQYCTSTTQQEMEQIDKAFASLGEKVTGEPKDIAKERSGLVTQRSGVEVRLAQCRLLNYKATALEEKLKKNQKESFTRDLFAEGPNILTIVLHPELRSLDWLLVTGKFLITGSGLTSLVPWHLIPILFLAGFGYFVGTKMDDLFIYHVGKITQEGLFFDFWRTIGQQKSTFPLLTALGGASLAVHFFMAGLRPLPYLPSAVDALLFALFFSIFGKVYGLILTDSGGTGAEERKLSASDLLRLHLLALFSGILWFVFASPLQNFLPEVTFYLLRALIVVLWYGALLWSFWMSCTFSRLETWRRTIRIVLVLVLGSVVLAELGGYRALATYLLVGTSGTIALILIFVIGKHLSSEVIGGFGRGKYGWQKTIRQKAGIKQTEVLRGVLWINSMFKLLLVFAFIHNLIRLWSISRVYASTYYSWLVQGFSFGTVTIVPSRVGIGFLIFALGWTLVSLAKDNIVRPWMTESELAPGVQDAFTTVLGYIAYSITILVSLSTAGIDFSGLAMVAGALSVGIGFGLQNIVNNLVSGLILLFERPIKRGDWISVGTTEGYVKKISVRSTIIQTFDRSDVIVPNSELISSQVTNMMLQDTRGRVRVAVGVAYGSNTALVKELLLEVAKNHPEVINNGTAPYPVVRFQAFGESSLDFELFCHLRDVDKRIDVRSDMHFAIDQAFRTHGIAIPFPQRDVHIKHDFPKTEEKKVVDETESEPEKL
ncbi:MAG: mechanosensitive ion channel [Proteobacteria bacterium]|nr:mechanosensitive ion channel [Pseudomonadota bacterium]MBU1060678.1 mechanosensitive ion channel [Pseudomonadota bacterium]